jgi:hypothetical protein
LPDCLFARDALLKGQIRPASFPGSRSVLRNPATDLVNVQNREIVRHGWLEHSHKQRHYSTGRE